jgi:light-regulated signal transduction histidine kinase (bacteriophytochrome)
MAGKPTYEELEQKLKELEKEFVVRKAAEDALQDSTRQLQVAHDQALVYARELKEEITERRRAEEALQEVQHELGRRVEDRTTELANTTQQLKLELTERRRAEEALRAAHDELEIKAAELEAANAELSQYDHVVAHVLKAPLRAVHNYTDFLRQSLEEALSEEQQGYLDNINRAVRDGTELVDDLLEFAVVGRQIAPTCTTDISVFLQDLIEALSLPPDVEVVMGNDKLMIDTDQALLKHILHHLITNAVKFNPSPRKRVEIGWLPAGQGQYEVFVRDNGIGIDPRYHQQILHVFERLHTSEEYEGTGLGLAIVKKAISKLRGSLRIESEPGEGSTFFVTLPEAQQEK